MKPLGLGSVGSTAPFCSTSPRYRTNSRIVVAVELLSLVALRTALERIGIQRTGVRSRDEIALIRHRIESSALENPLSSGERALAFATGGIGYAVSQLVDRYLASKKIPIIEYVTWTVTKPLTSKELRQQFSGVEFDKGATEGGAARP